MMFYDVLFKFFTPLSQQQAKDIVTFCSGSVILNTIHWLKHATGER